MERPTRCRHSAAMAPNDAPVPDLTARQLLAVLTVAEQGSFVAAASVLKTSQPALTRTIQRVEDVLGTALFERTTRRVRPTAAGRAFLPVAERLLHELRFAARSLRAAASAAEARGRVVLASLMSAATGGPLPAILAAWCAARPAVEVELREGVHGAVLAEVRGGGADFGIAYLDPLPEDLEALPLGLERFALVVPAAHPLARREGDPGGVSLAALAGERLIAFPPDSRTRRLIEEAEAEAGIALRRAALTVGQVATMLRLVRAGAGVAIVPSGAVAGSGGGEQGLVALPLASPALARRIGIVLPRGRGLPAPAADLRDALLEAWPAGPIDA
jgi:DNA-binding transcriptional LysR family regulator